MIVINGMPDHLHVFVGLHPTQSISDLMRVMKGESSEWINSKKFVKGKFEWQACLPKGQFGPQAGRIWRFSYGRSQINQVYNYVMNQKKHHEKKSFKNEYIQLLKAFEIKYDERYIFHEI